MTQTSSETMTSFLVRRGHVDDETVRRVVHHLCERVVDDHVAVDIRSVGANDEEVGAESPADVLEHLARYPNLVEFLGSSVEPTTSGPPVCVIDDRFLTFRRLAHAEWRVARAVLASLEGPVEWPSGFRRPDDPELLAAAERILTHRLSLVVGGPGTGKTTLVTRVLSALDRGSAPGAELSVLLVAPTGKAVVRLTEGVTARADEEGWRAVRIDRSRSGSLHHVLGVTPESTRARHSVDADIVVVDEASMASLGLVSELVRSLSPTSRLVLIGDPHQLASVDEGSVLADLVSASPATDVLTTTLTRVHRTDSHGILSAAWAILEGDVTSLRAVATSSPDVRLEDSVSPDLLHRVGQQALRVGHVALSGSPDDALRALRDLVVLCAHREGVGSTRWWREQVGRYHRLDFPRILGAPFSVGEPVIVTRTQRHLRVVNGDVGVILPGRGQPQVYFGDGRTWPLAGVGHLESAWALTIHKSQGSEYGEVVVSLGEREESALLSRELVYTALTRAQRSVTIVAEPSLLSSAVSRRVSRTSALAWRLGVR